jgi:regulatory factor X
LNVLRAVALSTNSVAASVEPVMQQQFFTLSPPMAAGPDYTGAGGMGASGIMDHTPTNILAALNESTYAQADGSFPSSFDGSSSYGVGGGAYGSLDAMNFMDHQSHGATPNTVNSADGLLSSVSGVDMAFGDAGFDVSGFTQEFAMTGTPAGDGGDPVAMSAAASSSVKDEGSPVVG